MKHVLMITNDTTFAYNLRREILQQLMADGYRVTLVGEILAFREEFESMGVELVDVKTGRHGTSIVQDLKLFTRYFSILRKKKPDIVLTNNIKPNVYAGLSCRLIRIPYIPNITGLGTAVEYEGKLQKLTTMLYKIGVGGAGSVLFQNTENLQFFKDRNLLSPKSKIVLLPGSGVNLQSHPAMPYPQGEQTHFLFIARVMKEKGIDLYLAAAKRIREKYPNAVFHICGGCDDEKYIAILKQEQEAGNIVYHGLQKNMVPFFEMANCIVHPSYYPEGMSNVLLEAAASARPIIATDRSGCRETVNDGNTGYLIPIKDEDALVKALESFMQLTPGQQEAMGLAGRAKVEREFDREIVVRMNLEETRACLNHEAVYGL